VNAQKTGLRVAGLIFGLVCLAHVWRLIADVDVRIGENLSFPPWASVVGVLVSGSLSIWMWMLSKK
jgi:tetrahydromethanopterin S-methyltransferase subunit E